ncbi:MAG: FTR1 family iron permease [Stenomitos rutilans HA7619-LM2]|jgi:high-affinity iron transporter|nr:FTR1 family iron permease [Stenomitos rutilans HA7619-LM2]
MDFSSALPTFIITLREGVEAALVVGIVLAYLKKAKQSHLNSWVYGGIAGGLIISAIVGLLFGLLLQTLGASNQKYAPVFEPLLEGVFSVAAIVMLSWMLVWMTQQARLLKGQVEGAINATLTGGSAAGWGIFGLVFFAVLREGFETVLFIAAKFQQGLVPAIGATAGIISAIAIGFLLFRWGVKINLRAFFLVMGVFLLLIVAGLVVSALGHLDVAISTLAQMDRQSEGLCFYYERFTKFPSCVLGPLVWNTSRVLPDSQFPGVILHTLFGYEDQLYLVQAVGYVVFLLVIGGIYLRSVMGWKLKPVKAVGVETSTSKSS